MKKKKVTVQDTKQQVEKWLSKVTPTPFIDNKLSDKMKVARITKHMTSIMKTLGLDLKDDSLMDTPKRIAKMYVHELFSGLKPEAFPKITCIENKMECDEMVSVSGIRVLSVCEHHFVTIDGYATVAYIPTKKVIGLSKINRIVDYFARRPQVQERLVKQIADVLVEILGTQDVAVHIKAKHYCVISRGVQDMESETTTTDLRGAFRKGEVRSEFLRSVKK
jgi:GTP cyclohydrolase IA